jgi:hypothetical protein
MGSTALVPSGYATRLRKSWPRAERGKRKICSTLPSDRRSQRRHTILNQEIKPGGRGSVGAETLCLSSLPASGAIVRRETCRYRLCTEQVENNHLVRRRPRGERGKGYCLARSGGPLPLGGLVVVLDVARVAAFRNKAQRPSVPMWNGIRPEPSSGTLRALGRPLAGALGDGRHVSAVGRKRAGLGCLAS